MIKLRRIVFSKTFYLYVFFAVFLDHLMTNIGVRVLGVKTEKNPYVYDHMVNGTYWSEFVPELIVGMFLIMIAVTLFGFIFLFLDWCFIEEEYHIVRKLWHIAAILSLITFLLIAIIPAEFFAQGVFWTIAIIIQSDFTLWTPKIILDIMLIVFTIGYAIFGASLLIKEAVVTNKCQNPSKDG